MGFEIIKCDQCGQDVEVDTDQPSKKLDPARDKQKSPMRLHICSGKPASLAGQFKLNPMTFMDSHVIVVTSEDQMDPNWTGKANFKLKASERNVVELEFLLDAKEDAIPAYWLPWKTKESTTMTLGDEADFFFTSELTNCRFSVIATDPKKPKVAHVAGDIVSPLKRNEAEIASGFADKDSAKLARRLSISNSAERKPFRQPVIPKKHDYHGQSGKEDEYSSSFVFGRRNGSGDWEFYAQVVKGNMASGFYKNGLSDDLQVLNFVNFETL